MAVQERQRIAREPRTTPTGLRTDDVTETAREHELFDGHERIMRWRDPVSGLNALVALHDRTIGPAVAPVRMASFRTLGQAMSDVLARSSVTTRRAMLTGVGLGGGAVTVIGNPRTGRSPALFRALGRLTNRMNGGLLLLPEMGLGAHDLDFSAMETPFVIGASPGGSGDGAVATAYGAYVALVATARRRLGREGLRGLAVSVLGVGRVGYALCALLAREDVHLLVADADGEAAGRAARDFGAAIVVPAALPRVRADVLVTCGGPGAIHAGNVGEVAPDIVVAVADGTLTEARLADELFQRGVLFVPECVAAAGALLNAVGELDRGGYDHDRAMARIRTIADAVTRILEAAARDGATPLATAVALAGSVARSRRGPLRLAALTPAWAHP